MMRSTHTPDFFLRPGIVSWGEDGWRIEELINPRNLSNVQDCYLNCKILNLSCFIHLHAAQGFRTAHNLLFRINLIIIYNPVTMSEVGLFSASFPDESLVPIPSNGVNIYPELGQVTPRVRTQIDPDEAVILAGGLQIGLGTLCSGEKMY